jgi:benzoyl-CoA reductase/2-hydroxyglutaryl-CoA dehydratase subunit BcrC/BadD/HgdB
MATAIAMPEEAEGVHGLTVPKYKKYKESEQGTKGGYEEDEKFGGKPISDKKLRQFVEKYKLQQLSDILVREGITTEFLCSQTDAQIDEVAAELTPFKIQQNKFVFAVKSLQKERKHKKKKKKLDAKSDKPPTAQHGHGHGRAVDALHVMKKMNQNLKIAIDRKTEHIKAKFGSNKTVTTWWYNGSDNVKHEIVLTHYTKLDKQMKSKRKLVVDQQERYSKKSNDVSFIIGHCVDRLKVCISYDKQKVARYELYINDQAFTALMSIEPVASFSL